MFTINAGAATPILTEITEDLISVEFQEGAEKTYIEITRDVDFDVTGEEYIFMPACCYDGNRFEVLKKKYPPMFTPSEAKVDMPVTITDVPRLNKDGSGVIEVTTGDVSTPCIGIYSKEKKRAMLFFTVQEIDGINLGLSYAKGKIGLNYPHMRHEQAYRWPQMVAAVDEGIDFSQGKKIEIPYRLLSFECESMETFYKTFFANRKCMQMDADMPEYLPFEKQFEIHKDKFNALNWREECRFYGVTTILDGGMAWQPGWVGGAMFTYPLMKLGGELEWNRGMDTLKYLFSTQAESGFFAEGTDEHGNIFGVNFANDYDQEWHLVRKSGDALYFIFKHFNLIKERNEEIPEAFIEGARKVADAFVKLWEQYKQFGQFVNIITGEIIVGGSTSGAIVPAGLVSAYQFFKDERYLEVARESAEFYFEKDLAKGYTTGGPEEILQCPDSESAFALLESFVELYDVTQEEKWLQYAEFATHLCSSWVVSYNYKFPSTSEFGRLGMKTVGSVFANLQNKHSAPGICTLSGSSLYKVYKWTQNELYYELLRDISLTISQYMSTEERPIFSWDVPKDASLLNDDSIIAPREKLPQGYICERVNMSDWESKRCIGGVFKGSCWSETSNLLMLAEVAELFLK